MSLYSQSLFRVFSVMVSISILLTFELPLAYSQVTALDLSKASLLTYDDESQDFLSLSPTSNEVGVPTLEGYQILNVEDDPYQEGLRVDFKGVAFVNHQEKVLILGYRGSDFNLPGTETVDAGIFFSVTGKNNPYSVISQQISRFLWNYNKELWVAALTGKISAEIVVEYASELTREAVLAGKISEQAYEAITQGVTQAIDLEKVILPFIFSRIGIQIDSRRTFRSFTEADAQDAITFAEKAISQVNRSSETRYQVYVTGHSLGGFLAQVAGAYHKLPVVTFNAPGAQEFYASYYPNEFQALKDTSFILNYLRENDIVGTFGKHLGEELKLPNFDDSPFLTSQKSQIQNKVDQDCEIHKKELENEERVFENDLKNHYWITQQALKTSHCVAYYWKTYVWRSQPATQDPFINTKGTFDVDKWAHQELSISQYISRNHSIQGLVDDIQIDSKFIPRLPELH